MSALRAKRRAVSEEALSKRRRLENDTGDNPQWQSPFPHAFSTRHTESPNAISSTSSGSSTAAPNSTPSIPSPNVPPGDPFHLRLPNSSNPIPMSNIPGQNQFLMFDHSRRAGANTFMLSSEDLPPSPTNSLVTTTPSSGVNRPIPIITAGEMGYFDTGVEVNNEKETCRHVIQLIGIRFHYLADADIVSKTMPARLTGNAALKYACRESQKREYYQLQTSVQAWHFAGLKRTINAMGVRNWRSSTVEERRSVLGAVWDQNPVEMARGSVGVAKHAVPIDIIFSDASELHLVWRRFHKTMFLWTCELLFRYRIRDPKQDQRLQCIEQWKNLPLRPILKQLKLGDHSAIPVQYSLGASSRHIPRAPENNVDFQLAE